MGHKTTQTHYVSRNSERHREEYAKGYPHLRIYENSEDEKIKELRKQLEQRDEEITIMKEIIAKMKPRIEFAESIADAVLLMRARIKENIKLGMKKLEKKLKEKEAKSLNLPPLLLWMVKSSIRLFYKFLS